MHECPAYSIFFLIGFSDSLLLNLVKEKLQTHFVFGK